MLLGLVLVVVVMQQASKPVIYQPFFGAHVSPVGNQDVARPETGPLSPQLLKLQELQKATIHPENRMVANQLIGTLPASDQQEWAASLTSWLNGSTDHQAPSTLQDVRGNLQTIEFPDEKTAGVQKKAWERTLNSLTSPIAISNAKSNATDSGANDLTCVIAMLSALEDAIASRVEDGTVWKGGDVGAFYMHLAQANWFSPDGVAAVGALPLLQQPDVFRGQLVRIHGGVARCERVKAQPNEFDIQEYWQLWLRPSDGADRPITVIVPDVPPSIASAIGPEGSSEDGPQVIVLGKFLKRLSYASTRGAELAPAIVGRLISVPNSSSDSLANNSSQPQRSSGRQTWLVLGAACLGGLVLAIIAMYRTAVAARQSRELRNAIRRDPDEFLDELSSSRSETS
jgi:hypothetical protein